MPAVDGVVDAPIEPPGGSLEVIGVATFPDGARAVVRMDRVVQTRNDVDSVDETPENHVAVPPYGEVALTGTYKGVTAAPVRVRVQADE